jgi:hypothetical protein
MAGVAGIALKALLLAPADEASAHRVRGVSLLVGGVGRLAIGAYRHAEPTGDVPERIGSSVAG